MAKIRGFKPDLWTDEDFVELSSYARLLWMGLWSYACDNGHLADRSKQIKMRVLPTDEINCAELLREIEARGLIRRVDGIITIPNFTKHQKPDKRYFQTCDVAGCARPGANPERETRGGNHEATSGARGGHTVASWGPHVDGDGEVMVKDGDGEVTAASKPRKKPSTSIPKDWAPTNDHLERALTAGVVLGREVDKFKAHAEANDRKAANWNAAFTQWLIRAAEYADQNRPAVQPPRNLPNSHDLELPPDGLNPQQYGEWAREQAKKRAGA